MSVKIVDANLRKAPWINTAAWINDGSVSNASEVLEAAKLDWEVQHTELSTVAINNEGAQILTLADKVCTTRVNKDGTASVLGITSPTYSIVQNGDIVDMVDAVTYESGAVYESAGELRGGKKIFLAAKLPHNLALTDQMIDPVNAFLIVSNTHDGTDSLRFEIKYLRQICTNGMKGWVRSSSIAFRHSARMKVSAENVRSALGVIMESVSEFNDLSLKLVNEKLSNADFYNAVQSMLPITDDMTERQKSVVTTRREALMEIYSGPTQENIKGTAWGMINAFTEYEQWAHTNRSTHQDVAERFMLGYGNDLSSALLEARV